MADTSKVAQSSIDAAGHAYDAAYKVINDKTTDVRIATEKAAHVAAEHLKGAGVASAVIGTAVSLLADVLTVAMDQITQVKKSGQTGLHDLIAATLSDALLIEVDPSDIPTGTDAKGQFRVNAALGGRFLGALKTFMSASGPVSGETAEKAVAAFMGFGMQLAVNTGLLAMVGGAVPFEHFNEIKEIGEMLEKSLGLGRLTRQFMAPYLQQLVQKPLTRQLAAQYRQDILAAHQLVVALLTGRMPSDQARKHLAEHGLPEDQIDELIAQGTPRLHPEETELLTALGLGPADSANNQIFAEGAPRPVIDGRLHVLAWKRINHVRESILNEVFSQIHSGFRPGTDMDAICATLGIPTDETALWRRKVGELIAIPRKRLSHADMLFLYEAGQLTLEEVGQWAAAEGYSSDDQQNLQVLFTLKAAASHSGKSGGAAAKAVHAHNEHVAYVTDEITGLWSRKPTPAEVNYWVTLLDQGDRTKHDFVTELKELPTTGPAIPPSP